MGEQSGATTPTVGDIIKALTAAQAWAVLVAMATVLAGAFTLGRYFTPSVKLSSHPVPCSEAKEWPKGVWIVWGHFVSDWKPVPGDEKFPQLTTRVMFDSSTSYVAQGDYEDVTKNQFRATLSQPMQPGAVIHIHGQNGAGYTSDMPNGVVSPDGCMIKGDVNDSVGHRSNVNYLFERSRYYVDP